LNYSTILVCDDRKAICGECQENIKRGGDQSNSFTTSNLHKHLKLLSSKSSKKQRRLPKEPADSSQNQSSSTVITLNNCFERFKI